MFKSSISIYSLLKTIVFLFLVLMLQSRTGNSQSFISGTNCSIDSVVVASPDCNSQCTGSIQVYAQGAGTLFYQWPGIPGASTPSLFGLCAGSYEVIITDSTGCVDSDSIIIEQPVPIGFSLSVNNSTCPGGCSGSITASPFDTVPYAFQWPGYMTSGPTLGNLCPGIYAVILTNPQGCSVIGSAQVGYNPPFNLNFLNTPASCLTSCDGTATVFANGTPPFSYQWGTGPIQNTQTAVNLCSGSYVVSVSDSTGCIVYDTVTVSQLPLPVISFNSSSPGCYGGCDGQAEVIVFGPGNYVFEWSTFPIQYSAIAVNLCSGYQYVQITDILNGCVWFDSVLVSDPAPSFLSFSTVPSFCDNICTGMATVFPSGAVPFSYLWQNGATTQSVDSLCPGVYSVTVTDSLGCSNSASITITPQELIFIVTDANCNNSCDGVAEVLLPTATLWQATWNTSPVQFSAVASQLCSGIYAVTISDSSGCLISDSIQVDEQQPINAVATYTTETCAGLCDATIVLDLSGNNPFAIVWSTLPGQFSDSVSQLCNGWYPVLITDSAGCSLTDSILVPEPEIPQFDFTTVENSCYNYCDASAVISPISPGTYTYEWLTSPPQFGTSSAGLCPGFTLVEVTAANGCTSIDSVLIIGTSQIYISFNSVNPTCTGICDGFVGCQIFGGTPGYSYFWSNGYLTPQIINVCDGTYVVTVTDANGCIDSNSVTLNDPDSIAISFAVTDASCAGCADGSVTALVTGGTPNYYYYWTPGGIGGVSIDSLVPGTYNLCVADDNLCIQCADAVVSFTNTLPEVAVAVNDVLVFPNPFSGKATIRFADSKSRLKGNFKLEVFDVWGRNVSDVSITAESHSFGTTELLIAAGKIAPGVYLFKITERDTQTVTGTFMIQY